MSGLSSGGLTSGSDNQEDPGLSLLKLMADPSALSARIAEYEAAKKAADNAVALVGKASQISSLLQSAKENSETAANTLAKAQSDAEAIFAKANAEAADLVSSARNKAEAANAAAEAATKAASLANTEAGKARSEAEAVIAAAKAEADKILYDAQTKAAEVETSKQNVEKMFASAAALKSKFEAKLKKLQAASEDD